MAMSISREIKSFLHPIIFHTILYNTPMKFIFSIIICIIFIGPKNSWSQNSSNTIVEDPIISRRCKSLLQERNEKIKYQQKLNTMLLRNEKLRERAKDNQEVVKQRLKLNKTQLKNTVRLTQIRIKAMEENIVRKGCPGITL